MEKMGLNEIRTAFREFYQSKGHYAHKSFSLVPDKDKSLLIINSGMAPLKPYFAGLETPPAKRMTTCQKCIRTGDIDNVGLTARHGTFFEMLGSFSFGDYFKEQSLIWGWEFITKVMKMPVEKIWATIYQDDDEAYEIWTKVIGISPDHIVRLGKDDNFWEIGVGPCGPCSEIYYDRGPEYGCGSPDCKPGCECDRYVEFWNHVFTQFSKDEEGNYAPLEHKNIDTGMGLERLACIMQGVDSIFDIDTIHFILDAVVARSGVAYHEGKAKTDVSIRIITDHIRSVTFMIGDGILPGNEGRGYVLRRLLRRAARHGKLLGIEGAFLAELSKKVIEISGDAYPEIREKSDYIYKVIASEEEKFSHTIDQGTLLLNEEMDNLKRSGGRTLDGETIFRLYDTFGFPLELTQEILQENGMEADADGFNRCMQQQKELARANRKTETDAGWADEAALFADFGSTRFVGYSTLCETACVQGILTGKESVKNVFKGQAAQIILDQTPFYAESGGQAGDTGILTAKDCKIKVTGTSKVKNTFVHNAEIIEGSLSVGDTIEAAVDTVRRNSCARNHTATHLLHKALKLTLGDHVQQAGSSVTPEALRFDFTHFEAISKETLTEIEALVNQKIAEFLPVTVQEMPIEEARKTGAAAQFGEKYGDTVRVVSIGDFSMEFCGGTHAANSGQIGLCKILSESGVAAGVRRIEAVTGLGAYKKMTEQEHLIQNAAELLKASPNQIPAKITALQDEIKNCRKELDELKAQAADSALSDILANAKVINGVKLICHNFKEYEAADLRMISDKLREGSKELIAVLAAENEGKVTFLVAVSDDLLEKGYHAGKMIKEIAAAAGGGGGGKANMAQAGAKDPSKIQAAFDVAASLI